MKIFYMMAVLMPAVFVCAGNDIILDDFEGGSYSPFWRVEGEAFGKAPAEGTLPAQQNVSGYGGLCLVNSYNGGDAPRGRLTSAPFKVERDYLDALVGGGKDKQRLYLRVMVGSEEAGRFTGENDERLHPRSMDLRAFRGKTAHMEIVDDASGGWGHINVDNILLTDEPKGIIGNSEFIVRNAKKYINIPVNNSSPARILKIFDISDSANPNCLFNAPVHLDFENPQWTMSFETGAGEGGNVRIEAGVRSGEPFEFKTSETFAPNGFPTEFLRPQFHFSAPQGWLNDPNGLVYWKDKWHMYYQLTPYSLNSGVKYWGYAVSDDLISWKHKSIAIRPVYHESGGDNAIWSGTAYADAENASRLFNKSGGIVYAYTFIGRGDFIAYSPDGSNIKTFETPITTVAGRDPCLFYHAPSGNWVALRYEIVKTDEWSESARKFAFYTSKDLREWKRTQLLDDFYECPYITAMPVNGDPAKMKYLIFDARGECVIGDFDGEKFTPDGGRQPKFLLGNGYAGQLWHNAPKGRVIDIAWMRQPVEDFAKSEMSFSQIMTMPFELELKYQDGKYRILVKPVVELEKYYYGEKKISNLRLGKGETPLKGFSGSSMMLEARFDMSNADRAGLRIGDVRITFDKSKNRYEIRGEGAQDKDSPVHMQRGGGDFEMLAAPGNELRFKLFADRSILEIFHSDGERMIAVYIPFGEKELNVSAFGDGAVLKELALRRIKGAYGTDSLEDL